SFAFGLPSGATQPMCRLFDVAAPQVPAQNDNINVFDKQCAAAQVPNTTPTQAAPQGTVSGSTPNSGAGAGTGTGAGTGAGNKSPSSGNNAGNNGAPSSGVQG
ncbi:hypothetical protein ACHAQH_008183, partial [Verticillium albo-atrum]